jgi:3-phenylpropionate/trans-cinnamate dioxygenase ferredoxin reductase subunit
VVRADLVVLGIGARPNVELAVDAGLDVSTGIDVDASLRTSAPGIFAAGDVAAAWHPGYARRLRVEHWDNAKRQGRMAALTLLDRDVTYDRTPYFYSDQFDLGMETFGLPADGDEVVMRRDGDAGLIALWLARGRAVAALQANAWGTSKALRKLVDLRTPVDAARVRDARTPLAEVFPIESAA